MQRGKKIDNWIFLLFLALFQQFNKWNIMRSEFCIETSFSFFFQSQPVKKMKKKYLRQIRRISSLKFFLFKNIIFLKNEKVAKKLYLHLNKFNFILYIVFAVSFFFVVCFETSNISWEEQSKTKKKNWLLVIDETFFAIGRNLKIFSNCLSSCFHIIFTCLLVFFFVFF